MEYDIGTQADLEKLLGQYESIRLEFKSARLLNTKEKSGIIADL